MLFKLPYVLALFLSSHCCSETFRLLGSYGGFVPEPTNQVFSALASGFSIGQSLLYAQNHLDENTLYIGCSEDVNDLVKTGVERSVSISVMNVSDPFEKEEVSIEREKVVVIIPSRFIEYITSKTVINQFLSVKAKNQLLIFVRFSCRENDLAIKRLLNSIMTMIVSDVNSIDSNVEFMFLMIEVLTLSDQTGRTTCIEYCLKGQEAIWNLSMRSTLVLMKVRGLRIV